MKNKNTRTIFMYVLVALLCVMVVSTFMQGGAQNGEEISYADFLYQVKANNVSAIMYSRQDSKVYGLNAVSSFTADQLPSNFDFYANVEEEVLHRDLAAIASVRTDAPIDQIDSSLYNVGSFAYAKLDSFSFWSIFPSLILLLSMAMLFFWFTRQQGGGNSIQSFGKSKARVVSGDHNKVTFADVAGADEEKAELVEVIDFLKSPQRFREMGARIPKGVLLMGPPGTGKTLLAKAVAGEAGAPFYSISGSDFVEMYVGVGASRVRDLFATAKKNAPAIIFIDEIDAVGRQRGAGLGGGHDEREQTLNQLLVEMDGFDPHAGIIVIAATNRSDILDPALLRPGRFDRQIVVNRPDVKGREEILKVHAKGKPLDVDVNLTVLAQRTPGFTGADLENVLNEAAILAVRGNRAKINMYDVEEAITRVIAGPQKKSRVVTPEDQRITAYHEAGHALVSRALPGTDSVHEISIIQRGMAAGYTMTLPDKETQHMQRAQLKDQMAMLLAGRVAEEIYIGDISTGASDDIKRATSIAQKMVTEWGMSEKVGTVYLGNGDEEVFLGRDIGSRHNYSDNVESLVDSEVNRLLNTAKGRAHEILAASHAQMEAVVAALLKREHLTGFQFENLCQMAEGKLEGSIDEVMAMVNPEEEERQRIVAEARKAEAEAEAARAETERLQNKAEAEAETAAQERREKEEERTGKTYIKKDEEDDEDDFWKP